MKPFKNTLSIFLVVISFLSVAKNKDEESLLAKKDKVSQQLNEKLSYTNSFFEYNGGQYEETFNYRFSNRNATVDFYKDKVVFGLRKVKKEFDPANLDSPIEFDYIVWQIDLNTTADITIQPTSSLVGSNVSYFNKEGRRVQRMQTDGVVYQDIYPNIDLVFYKSTKGDLKYDFKLHPGALLSDIKLSYQDVGDMSIKEDGSLSYSTNWGYISEEKPYSYWNENEEEVAITYALNGNDLSFQADFDEVKEELTLDPIYVDWSSYFYGTGVSTTGFGNGYTWVYDLDIDDEDHVYVAGITSDRFPSISIGFDTTANGYYDAFVCKMTPKGDSIEWFSYLGGSQYEYCFSIAVNSDQEPVVSGFTWSTDFPITAGSYDNTPNINNGSGNRYAGYVTKFNSTGDSLLFSTYLGGSSSDLIQSMVLDDAGNIYLTGQTSSTDFPITAGVFQTTYGGSINGGSWWNGGDAFLTKMNPTGSALVFSTYIGGVGDDVAYEVALSPAGDIYIVGKTNSVDFPTTAGSNVFNYGVNGINDGFICKLNSSATVLSYSKMMGGTGEDWFEGIYVNERDEAYVAGISRSSDFYTTNNAYQRTSGGGADAVVVKMNPGGQNVYYSTYLGGSGDELYYSGFIYNSNVRIAANVREEPIICGITRSNNFPVTADALRLTNPSSTGGGWWNTSATIAKLDFTGSKLLYGTYYGGSGYEVPGANKLKRVSCFTNILYGGFTASSDFPTTSGVYKEKKGTGGAGFFWTGFIAKFRDTLYTDDIDLSLDDTITECDQVFEILNAKNTGADILWSSGGDEQYEIARDTGILWVQATYGCDTVRDSVYFVREYSPVVPVLPEDSTYCDVLPPITLDAKNDTILATYMWNTGATTQTLDVDKDTTYWVDIITPNCGTKRETVTYKLLTTPNPQLPSDSLFCDSTRIQLDAKTMADNEEDYIWNTGEDTAIITVTDSGYYKVVSSNYCGTDSAEFRASQLLTPTISLPVDSQFCGLVDLLLKFGTPDNEEFYTRVTLPNSSSESSSELSIPDSLLVTSATSFSIRVSNACGVASDTFISTLIFAPDVYLGNDTTLCDAVSLALKAGLADNDEQYLWSNNATADSMTASEEGEYWVEVTNKCGTSRDSIMLYQVESPSVDLPADSVFCDKVQMTLNADMEEECDYVWNTSNTDSAIQISDVGVYRVTVSNYCGSASDSIVVGMITSPEVDLGADEIFCGGVQPMTYTVGKEDNEEVYSWSNGLFSNNAEFNTVGNHYVTISNKCNTASDTINFSISPNPTVNLGPDTTLCGNFSLTLDAGNPGMRYVWMPTGETTQTIQATEQTIYTVTVYNDNECEGSDDFEVKPDCISKSFIPTAFSPNGDGLNDVFRPTLINFEDYSLSIYNRWGEKIYESTDVDEGWNGTYKGSLVQNGVYIFKMRYKTTEDLLWQNVGGTVNVVR